MYLPLSNVSFHPYKNKISLQSNRNTIDMFRGNGSWVFPHVILIDSRRGRPILWALSDCLSVCQKRHESWTTLSVVPFFFCRMARRTLMKPDFEKNLVSRKKGGKTPFRDPFLRFYGFFSKNDWKNFFNFLVFMQSSVLLSIPWKLQVRENLRFLCLQLSRPLFLDFAI